MPEVLGKMLAELAGPCSLAGSRMLNSQTICATAEELKSAMWPVPIFGRLDTFCVGGLPAHVHGMCRLERLGLHLG